MAEEPSSRTACPYSRGDLIVEKYLLEKMIGSGGMCTVWVATHTGLDRRVALKFLRSDLPESEADRLLREARAEARLEHPAIIRVFDYGETEAGHPFIVMELLEGESMADALARCGPFSPVGACRLLLPIIDALAVTHDAGIVHRDLKPENVFFAREGGRTQPKLLDFGIAKLKTKDPKPSLTLRGAVLGSPAYMAPEQAKGQSDVDHRSDVWAACMVLYEAVNGTTPFRGDNYNAILRSIIEDDIPPLAEHGAGERALWSILSKGLTKDREARFQSMRELGLALSEFLIGRGVDADVCGTPLRTTFAAVEPPREAVSAIADLNVRSTDEGAPGGTLKVVPRPAFAGGGSTRAVVMTRRAVRQSRSPAVLAMRVAAMLFGCIVALVIPKPIVDSPDGARAALARARDGAVDLATTFRRRLSANPPSFGAPSEPLATDGDSPPHPPSFAHNAFRPAHAAGAAVERTPIVAPAPTPPSRPSRKSHRVEVDGVSKDVAVTRNADPSDGPSVGEGVTADDGTLRALGLKAPYK